MWKGDREEVRYWGMKGERRCKMEDGKRKMGKVDRMQESEVSRRKRRDGKESTSLYRLTLTSLKLWMTRHYTSKFTEESIITFLICTIEIVNCNEIE